MIIQRRFMTCILAVGMCVCGVAVISADPLPTEFLKFQQKPLNGAFAVGRSWFGHDELSTAVGTHATIAADGTRIAGDYPSGTFMADDFADTFDTPVVHVRWWGSYIDGVGEPAEAGGGGVQRFLISWETDVPADPDVAGSFSHPGEPLRSEVLKKVTSDGALLPRSGTFTEKFVSAGGDPLNESLYEYNAELARPFDQQADTVYWLKIVALNDVARDGGDIQWGWHNRDWTVTDAFASTGPAVDPGEHNAGYVGPTAFPDERKSVWHFQDDAVKGTIRGIVDEGGFGGVRFEEQTDLFPQRYIEGVDGPVTVERLSCLPGFPGCIDPLPEITQIGIGNFSKDLAFELYSIPEPGTAGLAALGLAMLSGYGWRRRRGGWTADERGGPDGCAHADVPGRQPVRHDD